MTVESRKSKVESRESRVASRESRVASGESRVQRVASHESRVASGEWLWSSSPPSRRRRAAAAEPLWDTGTFSILGYDPATGEVGGAVQSRVFSVGNGVLWADADAGVAATQAIVDVGYGPKALELLRQGHDARGDRQADSRAGSRSAARTTGRKQGRQFAVMNLKGEYAALHRPEGDGVGRPQERQVRDRAGQHPRRAGGRRQHDRARSRRRPATCRSAWSRRSKAARPAAATSAASSRRRS